MTAIPKPGAIAPATRQQARRIRRGGTRCSRCGFPLTGAQASCFDDGKDAHLACSTRRNEAIAEASAEMEGQRALAARQRATELGLAQAAPALWTPPRSASSAPLDLSKAHLLSPTS